MVQALPELEFAALSQLWALAWAASPSVSVCMASHDSGRIEPTLSSKSPDSRCRRHGLSTRPPPCLCRA